jgi:hypothetical protein
MFYVLHYNALQQTTGGASKLFFKQNMFRFMTFKSSINKNYVEACTVKAVFERTCVDVSCWPAKSCH